ncbi:hypothetical protein C1H46_040295 [Malus baccata]|uniref:Uncharacterized protein n=1 Tax=Malus baccata TaxID=106549 RepID=A0A540KIY7_MALBA|nr:hypothetical protein C1H46_040295 [Malus baccata]
MYLSGAKMKAWPGGSVGVSVTVRAEPGKEEDEEEESQRWAGVGNGILQGCGGYWATAFKFDK